MASSEAQSQGSLRCLSGKEGAALAECVGRHISLAGNVLDAEAWRATGNRMWGQRSLSLHENKQEMSCDARAGELCHLKQEAGSQC